MCFLVSTEGLCTHLLHLPTAVPGWSHQPPSPSVSCSSALHEGNFCYKPTHLWAFLPSGFILRETKRAQMWWRWNWGGGLWAREWRKTEERIWWWETSRNRVCKVQLYICGRKKWEQTHNCGIKQHKSMWLKEIDPQTPSQFNLHKFLPLLWAESTQELPPARGDNQPLTLLVLSKSPNISPRAGNHCGSN